MLREDGQELHSRADADTRRHTKREVLLRGTKVGVPRHAHQAETLRLPQRDFFAETLLLPAASRPYRVRPAFRAFVLKYKGRLDGDRNADDLDPTPPMDRALKEELGLKVEAAKGSARVLVIDHIDKPSEN